MYGEPELREIADRSEWEARSRLLSSRGLSLPEDSRQLAGTSGILALGLFEGEKLIATGSLIDGILQGIAVDAEEEGSGAAAKILTGLIKRASARGQRHLFLYTKPAEAPRFASLGFVLLAETELGGELAGMNAALLEWGPDNIAAYREGLQKCAMGRPDGAGIIVMNCDPFTLGHRWLIQKAASESPWLYILVVEEEASVFPFAGRLAMVREGCAGLSNVTVIAGGPYAISRATFPDYFLKADALPGSGMTGRKPEAIALVHAALDLELFKRHIAPSLKARVRYAGEEPYSPTTAMYNGLMRDILEKPALSSPADACARNAAGCPDWNLRIRILPRFEIGDKPVSASAVRRALAEGASADALIPESTRRWLSSPEARPVLEKLRAGRISASADSAAERNDSSPRQSCSH